MTTPGVTAPGGWLAAGVRAGTKPSGELDLALLWSERPASVAGAFTTNRAPSAHVHVCRPRVSRGRAQGVLISAGIANAGTGRAGIGDTERLGSLAAGELGAPNDHILVCATGSIGGRIPVDDILPAINAAAEHLSRDGGADAAYAIMTTDTRPKTAARSFEIEGQAVTIGGMAKGAGMIAPRMEVPHATMLAFLTCDGRAEPETLRRALTAGLPDTFNAVTVDGAMSTNDTVLLFANGDVDVAVDGSETFAHAVYEVMSDLATAIARDGEGATKLVRMRVTGAASEADARVAARELAGSILFRAALWGRDPNWGRVLQTLGQVPGIGFDPDRVRIGIGGVPLAVDGVATGREAEAASALDADEVVVEADLGLGDAGADILTCDLTPEYVQLNAAYET